ncbi:MAG TPA: PadR family transcriptional regulator [Gryllotalpicola sp.]
MDSTQLLKGVLDMAVLAVVQDEDGYGYDIVRRLRDSGLEGVGDASVYGTLRRLYAAGALSTYVVPSEDGPHRKYYGINTEGRALLARQKSTWSQFSAAVSNLVGAGLRAGQARRTPAPAPARAIGAK